MSKNSLAERLAYANKMMPKILDSAEKPLTVRTISISHTCALKMLIIITFEHPVNPLFFFYRAIGGG